MRALRAPYVSLFCTLSVLYLYVTVDVDVQESESEPVITGISFNRDAAPPPGVHVVHRPVAQPAAIPYVPAKQGKTQRKCRYMPGQVIRHFKKLGVIRECDVTFTGQKRDFSCFARGAEQPFYTVTMDKGRVESTDDTRYIPEEEIEVVRRAANGRMLPPTPVAHSDIARFFPDGFDRAVGEYRPWRLHTDQKGVTALLAPT